MPPDSNGSTMPAPLSLILELSRAMLDAARHGDWAAVSDYEQKRRALITRTFAEKTDLTGIAAFVTDIAEVLRLDHELIALAESVRGDIAGQLGTLRKNKKAIKAYKSPATAL